MSSLDRKRSRRADDTGQARTVAIQQFSKGDRVRHRTNGKVGSFIESHYGFALPEVWVQFDSETDIQVPISCNPLDLELVARDCDVKANDAASEIVEELTQQEESDRHHLERKVESAFREAAVALKELRDRRLYRSTHKTFEEYCRERFGFNRSRSYQLIDAATVVENLEKCPQFVDILPTNEAQCRPLLNLNLEDQRAVWSAIVESGQRPTGTSVKQKVAQLEAQGIVERLKAKPIVSAKEYCQVGDIFTLVRLEGKERKYNGCWAIATEPRDFTVIVDVHDTTLTVKPENLNKIDSPEAHRQLPQILQRIRRVRQVPGFRDRAAYTMLEHLGKQTYLTPLEDKLLQVIEQEYGVEDVNSEIGS